ncbi:MAG: NAD(P)-binding domain-containing protein [Ignavibacteriales bacterium]|nr:NAD(P)-binding domain-containing protein [Ignavibacteriales bacterium]
MKIGIIGAGQIGSALIRLYRKAGHSVKMTNASKVEKLEALESETGAKAVPLNEVVKDVDVLVISVPLIEIPKLAKSLGESISLDTIIIDTTNYYPIRDGRIEEIENGMLESIFVSNQLSRPVIKVYNSILAGSLCQAGLPNGTNSRIALPISGDDKQAKQVVATLLSDSGFDAFDIGNLSDSWRQQPGSPVYCTDLNLSQLRRNIQKAQKEFLPERRELALQFILKQNPALWLEWWRDCVTNNRIVYETDLND